MIRYSHARQFAVPILSLDADNSLCPCPMIRCAYAGLADLFVIGAVENSMNHGPTRPRRSSRSAREVTNVAPPWRVSTPKLPLLIRLNL